MRMVGQVVTYWQSVLSHVAPLDNSADSGLLSAVRFRAPEVHTGIRIDNTRGACVSEENGNVCMEFNTNSLCTTTQPEHFVA